MAMVLKSTYLLLLPSLKPNSPSSIPPFKISTVSLIHPLSSKARIFSLAEQKEQRVGTIVLDEEEQMDNGEDIMLLCQLYICNLPRSFGVPQLLELFSPFGTVNSVEVLRDPTTGLSRGCGYVTMNSYLQAKEAISALDGSNLEGRQILVKFSSETDSETKRNKRPVFTELFYESPYKIYIGNLPWSIRPKDLRDYFSRFGTVLSARMVHDRKEGKHRVYGFVSFGSEEERQASLSSNLSRIHGREMLIRALYDENR